jgi:hypothetical protein
MFIKLSPAFAGAPQRRAHIQSLPIAYTSSAFFTEDELHVCRGSSLYCTTYQLLDQIDTDYSTLVRTVFLPNLDVFPLTHFTRAEYTYALATIWSRGMDFAAPPHRLICPILDMVNHSFGIPTCHALDPLQQRVNILAGAPIQEGDQIFINYGPVGNARLLRLYGFVIPNNPHSAYDLILTTDPQAPLFAEKLALWIQCGLCSASDPRSATYGYCSVPLTLAALLPIKVLQYMRIQRASSSAELQQLRQQSPMAAASLNVSQEIEILTALNGAFSSMLSDFAPVSEFSALPVGSNSWAASIVSTEERAILTASQSAVCTALSAIE